MSAILRELVSHASRMEWYNMRRYSAFAAGVCDVYVCVCERCGLFRKIILILLLLLLLLLIIIIITKRLRTMWACYLNHTTTTSHTTHSARQNKQAV